MVDPGNGGAPGGRAELADPVAERGGPHQLGLSQMHLLLESQSASNDSFILQKSIQSKDSDS